MSSGRSVDGLQKRTAKKGGARATSSTAMTRRKTIKSVKVTKSSIAQARHTDLKKGATKSRIQSARSTRRTIGIPEDERELKRIQRNNKLNEEILTSGARRSISENVSEAAANEPYLEDDDREAVRDFLDNIKDSDPTDIADMPKRKDSKAWHKKMKKAAKKNEKKKGIGKYIAIAIVLLVVVGLVAAYKYLDNFIADITDGGSLINVIASDPDTPLEKDENGRTNIIVFGTEGYDMDDPNYDGGFLTDSMMLISVDQETGDMKAVSLPRDLYYNVYGYACTGTAKLNEVFWCKYSQTDGSADQNKEFDKEGAQALSEAFEDILGVDVQYYVHANWMALIQVINAVDGIDVVFTYGDQTWDGPETEIKTTSPDGIADGNAYKLYYQYPNGQPVHLNGDEALAVARTRNAYGGYGAMNGNFSREYFQQKIVEATLKRVKEKGLSFTSALGIKNAIGENIRSNFKDTELKTMLNLANKLDFQHITTISLFNSENDKQSEALMTTGMINGISYVYPSAGAGNYSMVHSYIKRRLMAGGFVDEEAAVIILNGTSTTGLAAIEREELEALGFEIQEVDNAPEDLRGLDGDRIYKNTSSKPQTEAALKKQYAGAEIITDIPESLAEYDFDYIILLGER